MPEDQSAVEATLGIELDRLREEIRQPSARSPYDTLEYACSRLAVINPLSAAGVFRFDGETDALAWIRFSLPPVEYMTDALHANRSDLSNTLQTGQLFQSNDADEHLEPRQFFVGLPAGDFDGSPVGLGLFSTRTLREDELSRLSSFGLLLGLIAENARLSQLIPDQDDSNSPARLIGYIAHELRTPLTGMRGNIQLAMMASKKGQHDRIPKRLEAAINGVDAMSGLVQKLLDVSRLERDAFPLTFHTVRAGELLSNAVAGFRDGAEPGRDSVQLSGDLDATISCDRDALQRTLTILLQTAAAYSGDSGELELSARESGEDLSIAVVYSGEQISADDLALLTTPLTSPGSSSSHDDHYSLDLAFSRGVIRQHGGWIALRSDRPDSGRQRIEIRLPTQAA